MNDSNDLKIEDLLCIAEQAQAQLELEIAENSRAQERISNLSSEVSILKNELLKKSETIVSLNEEIESLSKSDLQLKKSKDLMAAGLKAKRVAEAIRSACDADRQALIRKESALADRESRLREKEDHIDREIKSKAEDLIKADRARLEREYKSRSQDNDRQTKAKQDELSKKYKTMMVTYKIEFMAVLIYGLISSILQAITTPVITEDIISFFTGLWKGIVGLYTLIEMLARNVAGLANYIDDPTASGIVYGIICVAIMVVLILTILIGLGLLLIRYGRYVRENQWDMYTVIAITVDIAVTLFFAEHIRALISVNLIVIQAGIFLVYSGVRAWIQHARGVY